MNIATNMLALLVAGQSAAPPPPTAAEIVEQMVAADNHRLANPAGYTSVRQYHLENQRFHKSARMTVRVDYDPAGTKTFKVVSEEGFKAVLRRVFRPMLEAESAVATRKIGRAAGFCLQTTTFN